SPRSPTPIPSSCSTPGASSNAAASANWWRRAAFSPGWCAKEVSPSRWRRPSSPRPSPRKSSASEPSDAGSERLSSGRLHDEGVAAARAVVDPHALGLQVALHGLCPVLAPEAGGLVAAERHQEAHRAIGVHPHRAGADALGYRGGSLHRLRPDAGAEAVGDVVGNRHRLLLVLELDDG